MPAKPGMASAKNINPQNEQVNTMKKRLGFIVSTVLAGTFAHVVMAADGSIDFAGSVSSTTCSVSVNGPKNTSVTLPAVSKALLSVGGKTAGRTPLDIQLTGCSTGTSQTVKTDVRVSFVPGENTNPNGRLDNAEDTGAATNVELQLLNEKLDPINLALGGVAQGTISQSLNSASVSIRHYVEYYATGEAKPGSVKSSVEYEISYE